MRNVRCSIEITFSTTKTAQNVNVVATTQTGLDTLKTSMQG